MQNALASNYSLHDRIKTGWGLAGKPGEILTSIVIGLNKLNEPAVIKKVGKLVSFSVIKVQKTTIFNMNYRYRPSGKPFPLLTLTEKHTNQIACKT